MTKRELLATRICDLGVSIDGTWLEERIEKVRSELVARGIKARPHFWLGDEWSVPDGVPGVAVPFYLAHDRLMALERSQMQTCEGGSLHECIKLLRHEVGHAVQNAYRLQRRRGFRASFGSVALPYPDYYRPDPRSKRFVLHLPGWYAQCHPAEDFAETFAVWLRPASNWRRRYAGWPAKRKIEFVDEIMKTVGPTTPPIRNRKQPFSVARLTETLEDYYTRKRDLYLAPFSEVYDAALREMFSSEARHRTRETAASFMRRNRRHVLAEVTRFATDLGPVVEHVLDEMMGRSRELGLRIKGREPALVRELSLALAVHGVDYARRGRSWWPV